MKKKSFITAAVIVLIVAGISVPVVKVNLKEQRREKQIKEIQKKHNELIVKYIDSDPDGHTENNDIYTIHYDKYDNMVTVLVNDRLLVHSDYGDGKSYTSLKDEYGNGAVFDYTDGDVEDFDTYGEELMAKYVEEEPVFQNNEELVDADNNDINVSCSYDDKKRLVRADDKNLGKTFVYAYDERSNIVSKKVYDYVDASHKPTHLKEKTNYGYALDWADCIRSYGDKRIETDEIGNVTAYNGWSYGWGDDNYLTLASNDKYNITYKNDNCGLRGNKCVNGVTTKYHYVDRKIVEQDDGTNKLIFKYDEYQNIQGVNINGTDYYYVKNTQGDVKWIVDKSGKILVSYLYDPWGKVEKITGELADSVGLLNPIRFRGYYYDNETGFYYMRKRYYSPELCRYINPEDFSIFRCQEEQYDLFSYCGNDPFNIETIVL